MSAQPPEIFLTKNNFLCSNSSIQRLKQVLIKHLLEQRKTQTTYVSHNAPDNQTTFLIYFTSSRFKLLKNLLSTINKTNEILIMFAKETRMEIDWLFIDSKSTVLPLL